MFGWSRFFLIVFTFFGAIGIVSALAVSDRSSNMETSCTGEVCTSTIYSYEKYWNNSGEWGEIDESFSDCSSDSRTRYCTPEYHFGAMLDDEGRLTINHGENSISLRLVNTTLGLPSFSPSRRHNEVRYDEVAPDVDIRYYAFPQKIKEEILILEAPESIPETGISFLFEQEGDLGSFEFERPYICDAHHVCSYLELSERERDLLEIVVPAAFFERPRLAYPLVIDPTLSMDSDWITWSAYVQHDGESYVRYEDPAQLYLANNSGENAVAHAGLEWLVDTIPDDSTVQNLTLSLYVIGGGGEYHNLAFHDLNLSSSYDGSRRT